jgi:hypothetical protein
MLSEATVPIPPVPDSVENLEYYRTRDDFMRAYVPATPEEKLLITQACRAWMHLQDFYNLRDSLIAGKGLLGLFNEDYDKYKQLMRDLAAAERMWRNAIQEFQRARRRGNGSLTPTRCTTVTGIRSLRPESSRPPVIVPSVSETARPQDESKPNPSPAPVSAPSNPHRSGRCDP